MELLRRRRAISTALALVLAVESVASVSVAASSYISAASRAAASQLPAAAAAGDVLTEARFDERSWAPTPAPTVISAPDAADYLHPKPVAPVAATPTPAPYSL